MARMPRNLDDAPYWWKRAEESRAIAERLSDPQAKGELRIVAETYEHLARNAEARARRRGARGNVKGYLAGSGNG
jgi:hypothetical protein